MTPSALSVKFFMAVRKWFWRKHRPAAGAEMRAVNCVIGGNVTVFFSRTFRDVEGLLPTPVLVEFASETAYVTGCLGPRKATTGA